MSAKEIRTGPLVLAAAAILVIGLAIALGHAQQKSESFPDLVSGLKVVLRS
jgi:phage-related protein